jgi:ribonuclease D
MRIIKTTADLTAFCETCANHDFVTVDTEFLRERTYYSKLCLIQMAYPGEDDDSAALIDVLAPEIDLAPLYKLFQDTSVVKVFHAARQDLEIFFVEAGVFPEPFFDTQIAAMVCGFGDQVGYETLVRSVAKASIDKSSRFTDWSHRPLSQKQMDYALGDVTHLRKIYLHLLDMLHKTNRFDWVQEELLSLVDPETYAADPKEAWRRVKTRNTSPRFLAVVRELADFRESHAQSRNIPRNRVYKDEALLELAATKPRDTNALGKSRLLMREARRGEIAEGILAAVDRGVKCDPENLPKPNKIRKNGNKNEGLQELLKVLLKATAEQSNVAHRLIASAADVEAIATGDLDVRAFTGWRYKIFGKEAERLINGEVALTVKGGRVKPVQINS